MGTEKNVSARNSMERACALFGTAHRGGRQVPPLPDAGRAWALFLDVDGTLLELKPTPDAVQVPRPLPPLLVQLYERLDGALAFVSGRTIATIDHLFAPLRLPCAGLHGVERRDARGRVHRAWRGNDGTLDQLRCAAFELARTLPGILVEDKHSTLALHYAQAPQHREALCRAASAIAERTGFELQAGHKLYELKPPGVDKGGAVTAFLDEAPFAGRAPVFLGDDLTDEYAHAVARARGGMAIQVGALTASVAQYALDDPAAVLRWLQHWEESLP